MPKKRRKSKNSTRNLILVVVIVAVVTLGVIGWHDGLIGVTSMEDINHGDIDNGTVVTVKGEYIGDLFNVHSVRDTDGNGIAFHWDGATPAVGSMVVVRGEVTSIITLGEVTSFEAVWVFG